MQNELICRRTRLFCYFVILCVFFQVLYVVRSPHPPSGFLETVVYSDRGGLQCPEPLLPVSQPLRHTTGTWYIPVQAIRFGKIGQVFIHPWYPQIGAFFSALLACVIGVLACLPLRRCFFHVADKFDVFV